MATIEQRLAKLEERVTQQAARVVFVRGGSGIKDEVSAFLASQGITGTDGELIVMHTIYEDRDGNPSGEPLKLDCVASLAGRRQLVH